MVLTHESAARGGCEGLSWKHPPESLKNVPRLSLLPVLGGECRRNAANTTLVSWAQVFAAISPALVFPAEGGLLERVRAPPRGPNQERAAGGNGLRAWLSWAWVRGRRREPRLVPQPPPLSFPDPPRNMQLKAFAESSGGSAVILLCTVESNPPAEVTLHRGGQLVASSASTTPTQRSPPPNALRLELPAAAAQDEGEYECRARSPLGSTSTSLPLHVQGERGTGGFGARCPPPSLSVGTLRGPEPCHPPAPPSPCLRQPSGWWCGRAARCTRARR